MNDEAGLFWLRLGPSRCLLHGASTWLTVVGPLARYSGSAWLTAPSAVLEGSSRLAVGCVCCLLCTDALLQPSLPMCHPGSPGGAGPGLSTPHRVCCAESSWSLSFCGFFRLCGHSSFAGCSVFCSLHCSLLLFPTSLWPQVWQCQHEETWQVQNQKGLEYSSPHFPFLLKSREVSSTRGHASLSGLPPARAPGGAHISLRVFECSFLAGRTMSRSP